MSAGAVTARNRAGFGLVAAGMLLVPGQWSFALADSLDFWTKRTSGTGSSLYAVTYGKGCFVGAGQAGTLLVSSNGADWRAVSSNVTNDLFGVAYADGRYLAAGSAGLMLKSTNGVDWFPQPTPATDRLNGIMRGGGSFVSTGNAGTLLTSPDGEVWTAQNSGTTHTLAGCAFGHEQFVAVGRGQSGPGTVLTSSNGVEWVDRSYPNRGVGFYAVAFGNGVFVAMDARGIPYTSTNTVTWSRQSSGNGDYIFGLTFAQGMFVGVGGPFSGGSQKIVTSPDGIHWQLRPVALTNSAALRAVAYGNGYFVAVGDKGLVVQSGPVFSLHVAGFSNGVPLLRLDGERGRVYQIQTRSNLAASDWVDLLVVTNATEIQTCFDAEAAGVPARFYRGLIP
jgi:hypothetical protein